MRAVQEQRIILEFPDHWQVIKYDDSAAYRHHAERSLQGPKAVDVVALDPSRRRLYLIELKDFRGHAIENRARLRPQAGQETLFQEIGEKVRDTIAGLVGAFRIAGGEWSERLGPIVAHLAASAREVAVVAWIEEDRVESDPRARLATYVRLLAPKVRWLTTRVVVANTAVNHLSEDGVVCRSLPAAE